MMMGVEPKSEIKCMFGSVYCGAQFESMLFVSGVEDKSWSNVCRHTQEYKCNGG